MDVNQVLVAGAAGLAKMEFWCVTHPEGDLVDTASKDLMVPVRVFCEALGMDWGDANEQGYTLGRATFTEKQIEHLSSEQLLGGLAPLMQTH